MKKLNSPPEHPYFKPETKSTKYDFIRETKAMIERYNSMPLRPEYNQ